MHFGSSLFNLLEPFGVLKIVKQRKRCGTILWDELSSGVCSWGGCQRWGGPFTALLPHAERRTRAWGAPVLPCGQEKTARQRLEEGNDSVVAQQKQEPQLQGGALAAASIHRWAPPPAPRCCCPCSTRCCPQGARPAPRAGRLWGAGLAPVLLVQAMAGVAKLPDQAVGFLPPCFHREKEGWDVPRCRGRLIKGVL